MARRDQTGKRRKLYTGSTPATAGSGSNGYAGGPGTPAYYFGSFIASVGGEYCRNGNVTEIGSSNLNWRLQGSGSWAIGRSFATNTVSSPMKTMFYDDPHLRQFNAKRRDHLGNFHHAIRVALDPVPATTVFAHGLDTSKIIYYNWYTSSAAETVAMTDTGKPFMRSSYVGDSRVNSITFDSTKATIVTVSGENAGYVTFEIITTP
jgi:hypothetical protein